MFSKSCEYAIRSVLYLAAHAEGDEKIGVSELSSNLEVPKHFLAKILQQLAKNQLISSLRGPTGGFYMTAENQESNLLKVIECIDGPHIFSKCILGLPECSDKNPCSLHDGMVVCRNKMLLRLQEETIQKTVARIKSDKLKI